MALILLTVVLAGVVLWLFVQGRESADPAAQPLVAAQPADNPVDPEDPASVERCAAEAALVARLLDATVTPADYRRAMAELAAADAGRNPVDVPPDRIG